MENIASKCSASFIFLLILSACAAPYSPLTSIPQGVGNLELNFSGFRNNQGEALIFIYPGSSGFPDAETSELIKIHRPIRERGVHFSLENFLYHAYAIAVLHDENLNAIMDKSLLGFPLEGFGFSRNPVPLFGPPDYEKSRFLFVSQHHLQTIEIQYPKMRKLKPGKRGSSAKLLK